MKGDERGRIHGRKIQGRDVVWQARDAVGQAMRKDPAIKRVISEAEQHGIAGDTRYVVLASFLLLQRQDILKENAALVNRIMSLENGTGGLIEKIRRRIAAWRKGLTSVSEAA